MGSRLKTYALTATGTATLATAGIANADIITSSGGPVTVVLGANYVTLFTVAEVDFRAGQDGSAPSTNQFFAYVTLYGNSASMATVGAGATIGVGFDGTTSQFRAFVGYNGGVGTFSGYLAHGTSRLIGFAVSDGTDNFYGWIDYSLSPTETAYTFTINSWAYNDVANQGIIAGQNTAAGSSAVPGLGGLAALAIGAAGVRSRRQRTVA